MDFFERYVEAEGAPGLRAAAKVLGLRQNTFISQLAADKAIFRHGKTWLPFADYQARGYFEVKTLVANGKVRLQTRFTPTGLVWAAQRYAGARSGPALPLSTDSNSNPNP